MLTEWIKEGADWAIHAWGLWGAGTLMALESMIVPVPSELVMPPVGMAVRQGHFVLWEAIAATSAGSLVGSLISYYAGYFGGKPLVMKVGRYLLVNEHHLDLTSRWFGRWGGVTVFVSRFVPVVRHLVSIPAGIARMNVAKFCVYTALGATMWNGLLLWVGWHLQDQWQTILKYRQPLDIAMAAALVVTVMAWYWIHLRRPRGVSSQAKA